MKKNIFVIFPSIWFLSSLIWNFLITSGGFSGFELSMIFLVFYYFFVSVKYFYFDADKK